LVCFYLRVRSAWKSGLLSEASTILPRGKRTRFVDDTWLYDRHGTRLCAHAPNPAMHRTSDANTATLNTASIMLPLH
jgi:hypothetical protein